MMGHTTSIESWATSRSIDDRRDGHWSAALAPPASAPLGTGPDKLGPAAGRRRQSWNHWLKTASGAWSEQVEHAWALQPTPQIVNVRLWRRRRRCGRRRFRLWCKRRRGSRRAGGIVFRLATSSFAVLMMKVRFAMEVGSLRSQCPSSLSQPARFYMVKY